MLNNVTNILGTINFGTAGGLLLLSDMILFAILAANWEAAGRLRLRPAKETLPPKR